jgi:hypothetical protein
MIPFNVPVGLPLVNPLSKKQLQFRKEYKITGITLQEAVNGVMYGNYRSFMDIKTETYSRERGRRHLIFNPFTRELEHVGRTMTGDIGASAGRGTAALMVAALGPVEWHMSIYPGATDTRVTMRFDTHANLFGGHFYIIAKAAADGVVLEDDWTTAGGADMKTSYMPMANLVLLTHPKGFEQIAGELVVEAKRARAAGMLYSGEIGTPSVNEDQKTATV